MAITFAVRGDSLVPRYSGDSFVEAAGSTPPSSIADAGAIGGSTLDLGGAGTLTQHRIHYNGIDNVPNTQGFSCLMRFYLYDNTQAVALWSFAGNGRAGNYGIGGFEVKYDATNITVAMGDENTLTGISAATFAHGGLSNATYYDLFVKYTGDTTTNGCEVFLNASSLGTTTSSRSWSNPRLKVYQGLGLGYANNAVNTYIRVNEFLFWEGTSINPASVGLTSGTGSLNGASRTAFVDVAAFDGSASTGGGPIRFGG